MPGKGHRNPEGVPEGPPAILYTIGDGVVRLITGSTVLRLHDLVLSNAIIIQSIEDPLEATQPHSLA